MLVLRTSSKRQRRPNVRLGEIGDVSAASSHKAELNSEEELWKHESEETALYPSCVFSGEMSSGFMVSDPGAWVSPKSLANGLHNRENRNPNSFKVSSELVVLGEAANAYKPPGLNFGIVTRKGRLLKRRGRFGFSGFTSTRAWNSEVTSEINNENGKGHRGNDFVGAPSNTFCDVYTVNDFVGAPSNTFCSGGETSDANKEARENECFEPISALHLCSDLDEFWTREACVEGDTLHSDEIPCVNPQPVAEYDKTGVGGSVVNSVKTWLEQLGFGKYVGLFQMHEVDEEALPLLTFEDLKEMGIYTVGPRRKMYTAIQHLKEGGGVSA
ncbi:uncharacterized protein LOC122651065 [Telopea speciosissima]|uniref:uncharacterized protein LOC122651065 n=1 Tax=Telopea speciosissima TaxID=54955 RepID=UPI001CC64F14|nr:uncharacterized protein LOC122651065 [Telopea speciosissima]